MQVTEVKYLRRYNLGDYQHEEFEVKAVVSEGDDVLDVFGNLKAQVAAAASGVAKASAPKTAPKPEIKEEKKVEAVAEAKEEVAPKKRMKVDEKVNEIKKEVTPKAAPKLPKTVPYDRMVRAHTDDLAAFINTELEVENFREDPKLAEKVKAFSMASVGVPFYDESGEILESFKEKVRKALA